MEEKIKVLFIRAKKLKSKGTNNTIEYFIDQEEPDMYEYASVYSWENVLEEVGKHKPKIIFMNQNDSMDTLQTLKTLKQLYPSVVIFVFLSDKNDNEQEVVDNYLAAGAYKCFFSTFSINTLVHDMYVSLNLE
jgi:CheY-like chemotaxis protein